MLFVDNGAFFFHTHQDMSQGLELIGKLCAKLGLEMYPGIEGNTSKTEAMYRPTADFYKTPRTIALPQAQTTALFKFSPADDNIDGDDVALTIGNTRTTKPKKDLTFSTMTQKKRE